MKKDEKILDLYITDFGYTTGEIKKPEKSDLFTRISVNVKKSLNKKKIYRKESLIGFGRGASWEVALMEFFSRNELVIALANVGGVIALAEYLIKLKNKYKYIKFGMTSAKWISLFKIKNFIGKKKLEKWKIIFEKEITENHFGFDEKSYIFIFKIITKGAEYYFTKIDWEGNIKIFKKFKPMKKDEKLVRKVTRQGKRSLAITIPSEIVDQLKIHERQKMVFKVERKRIVISDWK